MKQVNDEEKKVLIDTVKKRNLVWENEHYYKLFDGDIDRVIYVLKR